MGLSGGSIAFVVLAVVGAALIILGGVLIPVFKDMIHMKIKEGVALKNGSDALNTWEDPPAPVYMNFYVFNVTNSEEVLANGSVPMLAERGPYVYKEVRPKNNVTFLSNGTLLSYREPKSYVFVEEKSVGPDNENFTSINLLLVKLLSIFEEDSEETKKLIGSIVYYTGERLLEENTVRGYLFGYNDRVLDKIKKECMKLPKFLHFICDKLPSPEVGLFIKDTGNGTDDGKYVIHTGTDNTDDINVIDSWKGNKSLDFWNTSYCNMINGTDGSMWHPFVEDDETLYLFSSDICRSIYLRYNKTYSLEDKVKLKRFVPPAEVFADPAINPDNRGFCVPKCLKGGVLPVKECKQGVPVVMSLPHFYQGDKKYRTDVKGMRPQQELHQTVIDVEPYTGATFSAHKRLQINLQIDNSSCVQDTKMLTDGIIFPLVWLDETATVTDKGIKKFVKAVYNPITMTVAIQYGLLGLGALLVLIALVVLTVLMVRRRMQARGEDTAGLVNSDTAGDE